jgi:hypothetical protein
LLKHDPPNQNRPHQGQQFKERPQKEIPPINKGVLQPHIERLKIDPIIPAHPREGVRGVQGITGVQECCQQRASWKRVSALPRNKEVKAE